MKSADLVSEREDYEELLGTRGWARFVKAVLDSWEGPGYFNRMGSALKAGPVDAQATHMAATEIRRILQIPSNRSTELKKHI